MIRQETSKLARWVVRAGIALILLIIVADAHEAWLDYRGALAYNERVQQALGRVLAEQAARMMQETDVVLSDYGDWVVSSEGRAADDATLRTRLRSEVMRLPFIFSATLADEDGRIRATTATDPNAGVVEAPARTLKDSLYVGNPSDGTGGMTRTFALSRRVESPAGDHSAVVVARVAFEYLTGLYASVDIATDTSIRLLRADGVVLAQYPARKSAAAVNVPRESDAGLAPGGERVLYRTTDGLDEVTAQRAVEGYPVIIEITRPMASILRRWVDNEMKSATRTLVLVLLAGALLVALRSALLRQANEEHERRRLEHDLETSRRLDAIGFLAASVAHDFNNVLSAIVGYGELARKNMATGSNEVANIDRLLAAAERARLLVRRVLTFDPRRNLEYAPVPLAPILIEVAQQIEASVLPTVTVELAGLDTPAFVYGDATEIHQVVMNLCTNAVHAMTSGGRLSIGLDRLEIEQPRALALGRLTPGAWICLSIADTGVGLTPTQIGAIFEPFYTTRSAEHGTGIGLTVVRHILTRMAGGLDVHSRVGAGTRMSVYWPARAPDASGMGVPRPRSAPGRGETVMVVDDKPELVSLAEEVLASLGYEPVGFSGARSALQAFRAEPRRFDVLVTDERMEGMGGCGLAKEIHAIDPKLPVILVTGYRDAELVLRAKDAAVAEILDKPLNTQVLSAALSRQLAGTNREDAHP